MVAALILASRLAIAPACSAPSSDMDFARVEWQRRAAAKDRELAQSATSYLNVTDIARVPRGASVFLDVATAHEKSRWLTEAPRSTGWIRLQNRVTDAAIVDARGTQTILRPGEIWRSANGLVVRIHAGEMMAVYLHDPKNSRLANFSGLSRFQFDPAAVFEADFRPGSLRPATFATTQGLKRRAYSAGRLAFSSRGKRYELDAFVWEDEGQPDELFVPFRDRTNGHETYAGGRYVDVRLPAGLSAGTLTLDFNNAYNPLCARSHFFDCVIYPGNRLPVDIRAGEKAPADATAARHG